MNKKSAAILIFFSIIIIFLIVFVNNTFINLLSHKTITSPTKQEEKWIANGPIHAILPASNNITYLGGDFTYIGPYTGGGVILNTVNNQLLNSFPKINGVINTVISDGKNGWYIGGNFSKVGEGELARHNIAHILPNGTVDENWNAGATEMFPEYYTTYSPTKGEVHTLSLSPDGSILYVGGNFKEIGGQKRNNIAALDTKTGLATEWNPDADKPIYILTFRHDGKILYVGGEFNTIGGQKRNALAALDTKTGLATEWNPNSGLLDPNTGLPHPFEQATIYTLSLGYNDSILYVGGHFSTIGGQKRNNIAALDTKTGLATEWNPVISPSYVEGEVYALSLNLDHSILYVGGNFTGIGGQRRIGLAALDTKTALATEWNSNVGTNFYVATFKENNLGTIYTLSLSPDGSILYVGGNFDQIGGQPHPLYDFDNTSSFGLGGIIHPDSSTIGGQIRNNFAAVDAKTGKVLPLNFNTSDTVLALSLNSNGSTLYIGGVFNSIGGEVRNHIAALNTSTGQPTKWNPDAFGNFILKSHGAKVDDVILSLSLNPDDSILYVGGNFDQIGGQKRNNIAALDTKTGLATEWNPNTGGTVRALSLSPDGSILYVGGNFKEIGGQKRNYLTAIDTKTGLATEWNPDVRINPSFPVEEMMDYWFGVHALVLSPDDSTLYIGGEFTSISGHERNNLAALNAKSRIITNWNPKPDGSVKTLSLSPDGSILYVGGNFKEIGGQKRNALAALDTKTGLATEWNPDVRYNNGSRGTIGNLFLSLDGSILYVSGEFDKIANQERKNIAAIDTKTGRPLSDEKLPKLPFSVFPVFY